MPALDHGTHKSKFKNNSRLEECRRRRNEVTMELRKLKKEDNLIKRRNIHVDNVVESPEKPDVSMSIDDMIAGLDSHDMDDILQATQACRKILSRQHNPPIDVMIDKGIVPKCIKNLSYDNPTLQFEAAWVITNIASGTKSQTRVVIDNNAIPILIDLLHSPHMNVIEQAVWALGNIAGDGPEARHILFSYNPMPALVHLCNANATITLVKNIVWTISNLCRQKDFDKIEDLQPALVLLRDLLTCQDKDVIADTCWAWSYLTDGSTKKIQMCIEANIVPHLVRLLQSDNTAILAPVLRAVGNIVTGNDIQTDIVINHGVLPHLKKLLNHERRNLVKEAAWAISNIAAGNERQIQQILNADLIPSLIYIICVGDHKSKREAAYTIMNITSGGNTQQIATLVTKDLLLSFCNLLESSDVQVITVVLDAISNMMKAAESVGELNRVAMMIEECGGLERIEILQNHENAAIYEKSVTIIDTYFGIEGIDENIAPMTTCDGSMTQLKFHVDEKTSNSGFYF